MSFEFATPVGPIFAHSPENLRTIGLREEDFVWSMEGVLRQARIVEAAGGSEVRARLTVLKPEKRAILLEHQRAGTLSKIGLSVNAQALAKAKEGGKLEMKFVAALPTVDIVHFPSAGGRLIRAVASAAPSLRFWPVAESGSASKGANQAHVAEKAMNWIDKVLAKIAEAKIKEPFAGLIKESATLHVDDEAWLANALKVSAPPPDAAPAREQEKAPPAGKPGAEGGEKPPAAAAPEDAIKKFTEAEKKFDAAAKRLEEREKAIDNRLKEQDEKAWKLRVEAYFAERKLNAAEADVVREQALGKTGDENALKALCDKALKVREANSWPASAVPMTFREGQTSVVTRAERVKMGIRSAIKGTMTDGVPMISGFREAYRGLTGVAEPQPNEIYEALSLFGRFWGIRQKAVQEARRSGLIRRGPKALEDIKEQLKKLVPVIQREAHALNAPLMSSPTFSHLAGVRETITLTQFADAFADVMFNELQDLYNLPAMNDFRKVFSVDVVDDFLPHYKTRVGGYGAPAAVAENAAYGAATSPSDEKSNATVTKRGDLETITFESVRNDKLDAIARIPRQFLGASMIDMIQGAFNLLRDGDSTVTTYDGVNLFAAGHSNITSDVAANVALSLSNLNTVRENMRKQTVKDSAISFLGGANVPKILVVPPNFEDEAQKLTQRIRYEGSIFEIENQLHKDLDYIVVDHWTSGQISNSWFAAGDPSLVGFFATILALDNEMPELFQENDPNVGNPFTNDAIRLKRRHIYAYRVDDHRQVYMMDSTT